MGGMSIIHWVILGVIAMFFFGPSRLPKMGQSLGEAIRGFKKGLEGTLDEDEKSRDQISGTGDQPKKDENPKA